MLTLRKLHTSGILLLSILCLETNTLIITIYININQQQNGIALLYQIIIHSEFTKEMNLFDFETQIFVNNRHLYIFDLVFVLQYTWPECLRDNVKLYVASQWLFEYKMKEKKAFRWTLPKGKGKKNQCVLQYHHGDKHCQYMALFGCSLAQRVLLRPWETVEGLRRLKPIKPALHNSSRQTASTLRGSVYVCVYVCLSV